MKQRVDQIFAFLRPVVGGPSLHDAIRSHQVLTPYAVLAVGLAATGTFVVSMQQPASTTIFISIFTTLLAGLVTLAAVVAITVLATRNLKMPAAEGDGYEGHEKHLNPWWNFASLYREFDSGTQQALRAEQMQVCVSQLGMMMLMNIASVIFVSVGIYKNAPPALLIAWSIAILLVSVSGLWSWWCKRENAKPSSVSKDAIHRVNSSAGMLGLLWGLGFAFFFASASSSGQMIIVCAAMGMFAGGIATLASIPGAAFKFGLGVVGPAVFRLVTLWNFEHVVLAAFALVYLASLTITVNVIYRNFVESFFDKRHQKKQADTISLLLREFEADAADWLWELDSNGCFIRLPDHVVQACAQTRGSSDCLGLNDLFPNGLDVINAVQSQRSFRDVVVPTDTVGQRHRWYSLSGRPTADGGYRGVGSDITDRIVAEQKASDALCRAVVAERNLTDAIRCQNTGFMLFNSDDELIICNELAARLLGVSSSRLGTGVLFQSFAASDAIQQLQENSSEFAAWLHTWRKRDLSAQLLWDVRLSEDAWVRIRESHVDNGNIVITIADVSDLKRQELVLVDRGDRLEAANVQLEQFATVAAHDLQEPLRKVEAFCSRLNFSENASADRKNEIYASKAQSAATRMRRLINDLLDYAQITKKSDTLETTNLTEVLGEVRRGLEHKIKETNATFLVGALPSVAATRVHMFQLFQNIIENALKYASPDRSPVITIGAIHEESAGEIRLQFSDNGIGFDPHHGEKVFEIFQRLHTMDKFDGTGIGLATCQKIAQLYNGRISATSEPDVGTTINVVLPSADTTC